MALFNWTHGAQTSGATENAFARLRTCPASARSPSYISATAPFARASGVVPMNVMRDQYQRRNGPAYVFRCVRENDISQLPSLHSAVSASRVTDLGVAVLPVRLSS